MHFKEARFHSGLTQFYLGLLTGIHQSRISYIERGYIKPREDEKQKIEKILNVEINWVETGTNKNRATA
jgi:transcriptional regulator with XRE-family HTH domain